MKTAVLARPPSFMLRVRTWLDAHTWTPSWHPSILRRPIYSYVLASAAVALASGLTWFIEYGLPRYTFHGMAGFVALLGVALVWGLGPAVLGAVLNALLLSVVVPAPYQAAPSARVSPLMSDLPTVLLALSFGLVVVQLASLTEARRRKLVVEQAMRERMLSMVTHDLVTPLTIITARTQLLRQKLPNVDDSAREYFRRGLQSIESSAWRSVAQLTDLLDHTRAQAGRPLELTLQAIDIVGVLREVLEEQQQTTKLHQLELRAEAEGIVVTVDRHRVERAVTNLVVNAIKYSPQGGPVVVTVARVVEPDGPWVCVSVADRGMGIPRADLPHLFEPYFRASNARTAAPGSGIGLAGVRHIVLSHGGTVTLESAEGVGTTVTLRLPFGQATPAAA